MQRTRKSTAMLFYLDDKADLAGHRVEFIETERAKPRRRRG